MIAVKKGKVTRDYKVLNTLGKGGFGEVKKVINKTTQDIRSMKIIKKSTIDESYISNLGSEA